MKRLLFYSIGAASHAVLRIGLLVLCGIPFSARANLFVSNGAATNGTIGEYSDSGLPLNPSLISGLSFVRDIAISGNKLFVLSSRKLSANHAKRRQKSDSSILERFE